jgi:hypothetical protein
VAAAARVRSLRAIIATAPPNTIIGLAQAYNQCAP